MPIARHGLMSYPHGGHYTLAEVGFITDFENKPLTPPDDWQQYSDGEFPSDVYGYVPTEIVEKFIAIHGGEITE